MERSDPQTVIAESLCDHMQGLAAFEQITASHSIAARVLAALDKAGLEVTDKEVEKPEPPGIGTTIRKARKAKHISLRKLADECDMAPSYLSHVETGKFDNPSVKIASRLADALDLTLDELINGTEDADGS